MILYRILLNIEVKYVNIRRFYKKLVANPSMVLALGFALLILTGGLLLNTRAVTKSGQAVGFINALFTAGSASCVTGLTVVNTFKTYNTLGHIVILVLIQIGGLGIMTMATLLPMLFHRKIGISGRNILREQLNLDSMKGVIKLLRYVVAFTFITEAIGALLLAIRFIPDLGLKKGLWYSVFHAISAFCNAGFDLFGDSIAGYHDDSLVNLTIMALVAIGGLGFLVTYELLTKKEKRVGYSTHTKIVLLSTGFLIIFGSLVILALEGANPDTLLGMPLKTKVLNSSFTSVISRTAGFFTMDISKIRESTSFFIIILMFIGASPGSTGGGLKTTTFGILFASMLSTIRGDVKVVIFKRRIPRGTVTKSLALVMISMFLVIGITFTITIIENFRFIDILFETVSAYATVGLTRGISEGLQDISKLLITLTMYLGRIGPLTMAVAFGQKKKISPLNYPEANVRVG